MSMLRFPCHSLSLIGNFLPAKAYISLEAICHLLVTPALLPTRWEGDFEKKMFFLQ
jgi:hypothetical protein